MIKNLKELAGEFGFQATNDDRNKSLLEKYIYKFTVCGASVEFKDNGVTIGSIVEGVDYGTEYYTLEFPFTKEVFWETIESVEAEAKQIWDETHEDDLPI